MNELLAGGKRLFVRLENGDLFDVTDEIALMSGQQDQVMHELATGLEEIQAEVDKGDVDLRWVEKRIARALIPYHSLVQG